MVLFQILRKNENKIGILYNTIPIFLRMAYTLIQISSSKPIYAVEGHPELFGKANVTKEEEQLQKKAALLGIAPRVHSRISHNGLEVLLMDKIPGMSLADFYGDKEKDIPPSVWKNVRELIQLLWNEGIEYVDVTPYNFMIDPESGKVWVIDFGHARSVKIDGYLALFLAGVNKWNNDYR